MMQWKKWVYKNMFVSDLLFLFICQPCYSLKLFKFHNNICQGTLLFNFLLQCGGVYDFYIR